jgi:hypothetical protein
MSQAPAGMKIMVSIGGYGPAGAEPVTLLAFKNNALGILVVLSKVTYREIPDEGFAFVTNLRLKNYDCLFKEEHLADAITAYKEAEGMGTISLAEDVGRWRPRIESDGVDTQGQKYRLNADIGNAEVAILALAHFMSRQRGIESLGKMSDDIARLYQITSI